jgi:hypothetical protein
MCQNHTLREQITLVRVVITVVSVEISFVRVETTLVSVVITFMRVKITMHVEITLSVHKSHSLSPPWIRACFITKINVTATPVRVPFAPLHVHS